MLRRFRPIIPCVFALLGGVLNAQQNDVPLNREIYYDIDHNGACLSNEEHTGLRPIIESRADLTNVMGYRPDSSRHYYDFTEKLFKEHLFIVHTKDFHLTIDPVFRFELGQDFRDPSEFADTTRFYVNSRGFLVRADIGPRISFQTTFYENQAIYPNYLYQFTQKSGVVPGQGRIKGFKNRGYDFAWAMGNVSWSPRRWLNVQLGNGKHFVGNGYRSVLLSDNAFNYPFVKLSYLSKSNKLQYTTIYAKLQLLQRLPTGASSENLFYWKRATFQHLSVNLGRAQVGLFESTMWNDIGTVEVNGSDSVMGVKPFNAMELNPVIGLNTLVNGFGGDNKSMLGLDLKLKLTDHLFTYGQFALDDPSESRYAWQLGMQAFNILHKDIHVLAEYNSATPYCYTNQPVQTAYTHYSQPLAHPAGAYFDEVVFIADARIKTRWIFQAKVNVIDYHLDPIDTLNYGGDLFKPDVPFGDDSMRVDRRMSMLDLNISWLMNQVTNMRLTVGFTLRDITNAPDFLGSGYLYGTWSTGLFNRYYDF